MTKVLLDTDIWSEIGRGKNPAVTARATAYSAQLGTYTLSVITVVEVIAGLRRTNADKQLQRFFELLETLEILNLDRPAATLAGRIHGDLTRTGRPIGLPDVLIAAIALRHDLPLVTGNTSHYAAIQALGFPLVLANWRESAS
jgi:predicted nucleic acid-binding protein